MDVSSKHCKVCLTKNNLKPCIKNNKTYIENICRPCFYTKYISKKCPCQHCGKTLTQPGLKYHLQNKICVN